MELHRSYCRRLGVSAEELAAVRPAPVTLAYTDYLLRVAYEGTLTDVIANLLPCQWGYYETGLHLARTGDTSEANPYAEWITMYSDPEFGKFVEWLRELPGLADSERGRGGDEQAGGQLPHLNPLRVPLLGDVVQPAGLAGVGTGEVAIPSVHPRIKAGQALSLWKDMNGRWGEQRRSSWRIEAA